MPFKFKSTPHYADNSNNAATSIIYERELAVGLEFINKKLDGLYKFLSSNDEPMYCQLCETEFTWHTWRNRCSCCDIVVCRNCISNYSENVNGDSETEHFSIKICTECWEPCTTAIKNMIVVKSGHVGGHITKKVVGELSTEKWEDVYDVETSLKYQAYVMGANAILKYKYIKHKNSKSTETGGTYYYNTFSGYGLAAVVEPNK